MEEIWKDVKGYEGLYQVSNFGRVKRLPYSITSRTPKGYVIKRFKGGFLKASIMANGYRRVTLYKDLNVKYMHVHRLVAEAFLPNPKNYPCVNHKDETRINNHVDNLEWCSYSYNNTYGTVKERCVKTYSKNHSRPVEMLSLSGEFLKTFKSVKEAALFIKGTVSSIERALNKTRKTAYGYIWNLI